MDRGGRDIFTTAVVDTTDTRSFRGSRGSGNASSTAVYDASMFRLGIPKARHASGSCGRPQRLQPTLTALACAQVLPGQTLTIRMLFFQPLDFSAGWYHLRLPATLPPGSEAGGPARRSASVAVNTGVPAPVTCGNLSHYFVTTRAGPGHVTMVSDTSKAYANSDVTLSYAVWGDGIVAAMTVQPAPPGPSAPGADGRSAFCLAVAPPSPERLPPCPRSILFLLDRSGSMTGLPMAAAAAAVKTGLRLLLKGDEFNIIAFDHEQLYFRPAGLVRAEPAALAAAAAWVDRDCTARGMTDIATPLMAASAILAGSGTGVPYIFLITDGAVDNEKAICRSVAAATAAARAAGAAQLARLARVWTFGIGQFCNHVFLKQLATEGRGMSDVAFTPARIQPQIERMLEAAARPVLTDVALLVEGLPPGLEIYPYPIPDLFCGRPLVLSGRFHGTMPQLVGLAGTLPGGAPYSQKVGVSASSGIPLDKVFVKQRLDIMTAKQWLTEDSSLKAEIVKLSVASGVPCAHTSMVGFNVRRTDLPKVELQRKMGSMKVAGLAVGGAAGIAVIGAVALSFGDLGGTLGNLPVGEAMDALSGDFVSIAMEAGTLCESLANCAIEDVVGAAQGVGACCCAIAAGL